MLNVQNVVIEKPTTGLFKLEVQMNQQPNFTDAPNVVQHGDIMVN